MTAPTTPDETKAQDPNDFEARWKAEKDLRAAVENERAYQIFKLEKEFKITKAQIDAWKEKYPLGVDLTWIRDKPLVYRALSLAEYMAIAEKETDQVKLTQAVAFRALLYPKFDKESDFLLAPAGWPTTIFGAVSKLSGFEDIVPLPL